MKLLFISAIIVLSSFHSFAQSNEDFKKKLQSMPGADTSSAIKELVSLMDRNYVSGHIYFYGAGFLHTELVSFFGNPFAITKSCFGKVRSGSKIAFSNCIYLDDKKQKKTFTKILTLP